MRKLPALFVCLGICLGVAGAPRASTIVTYDFSSSDSLLYVFFGSLTTTVPTQGSFSGSAQVEYTTDASGNIVDGPAVFRSLVMDATFASSNADLAFGGTMHVELAAPVSGTLFHFPPDLVGVGFEGAPATFHTSGATTCEVGFICPVGGWEPGIAKPFDSTASIPLEHAFALHGAVLGADFPGIETAIAQADPFSTVFMAYSLYLDRAPPPPSTPEPAGLGLAAALVVAGARCARRGHWVAGRGVNP